MKGFFIQGMIKLVKLASMSHLTLHSFQFLIKSGNFKYSIWRSKISLIKE